MESPAQRLPTTPACSFLLATRSKTLTTAALGEPQWRIGASTATGIALITRQDSDQQMATRDDSAVEVLAGWAGQWRAQGRPGLGQMQAVLDQGEGGWVVHPARAADMPESRAPAR